MVKGYFGIEYDVVFIFDVLYDMGDLVGVVVYICEMFKNDGMFMLVEFMVGGEVEENFYFFGVVFYGYFIMVCIFCLLF